MQDYSVVLIFGLTILSLFVVMLAIVWFGWWMQNQKRTVSPYTGLPMRRAMDLTYAHLARIATFFVELQGYDNRMFDVRKASFCRETGRIFPNTINWLGEIKIDWTFLNKRYPGNWISWGSLTQDQQESVRSLHTSLQGFQTEESCPIPSPRYIEDRYVYTIPGPLYVDLDTKILLGWKQVPGTELEVLILQRPQKKLQGIHS